jgi:RIO kinase 1
MRMMREVETNPDVSLLIDDGWIEEVLFPVKSGKEATVYCCRAHRDRDAEYFALKVYTPRAQRNFRNAADYQEGRIFGKHREERAVANKSRRGREFEFSAWLGHEHAILSHLNRAGVAVPKPVKSSGGTLLLEFIGQDGVPAPQLHHVKLSSTEAEGLLEDALRNIEIMLANHVVHGDLSAYNILHVGGRLRIIDVPQAVDARRNAHARRLLARDIANVCRYFAAQGADAEPGTFADELWGMYERAVL